MCGETFTNNTVVPSKLKRRFATNLSSLAYRSAAPSSCDGTEQKSRQRVYDFISMNFRSGPGN
jgi:hypothetical protein